MDRLGLFATLLLSLFLEAAPFLLAGAFLGALVEVYLPAKQLARFFPKTRAGGVAVGLAAGLLLPTCECGSVPVARRLLGKGVPAPAALTYMLAAPVINPVVLVSTYVAFRGDLKMVLARLILVLTPAVLLGAGFGGSTPGELLRRPRDEDLAHEDCRRFLEVLRHTGTDFMDMGRFLLLGCMASAFLKTVVPAQVLLPFKNNILLSLAVMMGLAILLSICSEADAFVAYSFGFFPPIAQLGFVGIGPLVDVKLISMYSSVFQRPVAWRLIIYPIIIVFALAALGAIVLRFGV
jgi:uncharacterized membrane protein YraQ (UPF0718 family)